MRFKISSEAARRAIGLMAQGIDVPAVAEAVGVSRNALYRLRKHIVEWFAFEETKHREAIQRLEVKVKSQKDRRLKISRLDKLESENGRLRKEIQARESELFALRRQLERASKGTKAEGAYVTPVKVTQPTSAGFYGRPKVRGDCLPGGVNEARPCPFVGCKYHLGITVGHNSGTVKILHDPPWEAYPSCALDVADSGEKTLEEVGDILGITRERIRQIQAKTFGKLSRRFPGLRKQLFDQGDDE